METSKKMFINFLIATNYILYYKNTTLFSYYSILRQVGFYELNFHYCFTQNYFHKT